MSFFRFTLLSDGSSDRTLIPHLTWLLKRNGVSLPIVSEWADLSRLRQRPNSLTEKIMRSLELYPCDLLFIHRDAERENPNNRRVEIEGAWFALRQNIIKPSFICVIPVRMSEAWLLFDENAIRRASGNSEGRVRINLPNLRNVENEPDPKEILFNSLRLASEQSGRKLKQLNADMPRLRYRVSELIEDFSPLLILPSFQQLETTIKELFSENELT
jgi:hypothetical protein